MDNAEDVRLIDHHTVDRDAGVVLDDDRMGGPANRYRIWLSDGLVDLEVLDVVGHEACALTRRNDAEAVSR